MNLQLENKTALVTGSTAGIGYAIALQLASEGAKVIVNGRTKARVEQAVVSIKEETGSQKVSGIAADFEKPEEVAELIKQVPEVDILVNNVAVIIPMEFRDITDEEWMRFYQVNVMSGVRLSRAYLDKMIDRNWGRIIFISSESAVQIPKEFIHYGMTKTAQVALSRGLAELTTATNVTVNSVLPGPTLSESLGGFVEGMMKEHQQSMEEIERNFFSTSRPSSILRRFITTNEIANMVVYLSSPLSAATNGASIRVDGGVIQSAV